MNAKIWTVVSCLIIGFLGGVGTVQLTMAKDVSQQGARIVALEASDKAQERNVEKMDAKWEKRLDNVLELWKSNLAQQQANQLQQAELISLVKQSIASRQ